MRVGVLALQGDFAAHAQALAAAGHETIFVRDAATLATIDALVLPGGESTVQLKLIDREPGLYDALDAFARKDRKPILATCAGLILAARHVTRPQQRSFGWLDVSVARNAWGRDADCFEARGDGGLPIVIIRGPRIVETAPHVEILERLDGEPVLVRQGAIVGATFHPELTRDRRVIDLCFGQTSARAMQ
jgi:5'-phosphate synthase pdxT subunit